MPVFEASGHVVKRSGICRNFCHGSDGLERRIEEQAAVRSGYERSDTVVARGSFRVCGGVGVEQLHTPSVYRNALFDLAYPEQARRRDELLDAVAHGRLEPAAAEGARGDWDSVRCARQSNQKTSTWVQSRGGSCR